MSGDEASDILGNWMFDNDLEFNDDFEVVKKDNSKDEDEEECHVCGTRENMCAGCEWTSACGDECRIEMMYTDCCLYNRDGSEARCKWHAAPNEEDE